MMLGIQTLSLILVRPQKEMRERKSPPSYRIYNHEQNIGRNRDGKGHSGKISDGNEEYVDNEKR